VQKFFRRGLTEHTTYVCKSGQNCIINPRTRNSCRYCRFQTCLRAGMSREGKHCRRPSAMDLSCCQLSLTVYSNTLHARADSRQYSRPVVMTRVTRERLICDGVILASVHWSLCINIPFRYVFTTPSNNELCRGGWLCACYVTLWPWPLSRWPWTIVVYPLSRVQTVYSKTEQSAAAMLAFKVGGFQLLWGPWDQY